MVLSGLCVFLWNFNLALCMLPSYFVALIGSVFVGCRCLSKESLAEFCIGVTNLGWRFAIFISFWCRLKVDGASTFRQNCGKTGRPVCVLMNHVSFMDTVLIVALVPIRQCMKVKMFVGNHIMKLPVVGRIAQTMLHLTVPFKVGADGKFSLDEEVMKKSMEILDKHIAKGGNAGWFPEGQMNRTDDNHNLGQFRAGGFSLAVKNDVEIWLTACVGNSVFWPRKGGIGGFPCRVGVKVFCFCESSKEFCKDVTAKAGEDLDRAKAIYLANETQKRCQEAINELVKEGFDGNLHEKAVAEKKED